jgi:class 3 adenylate cyclase/predicted ATPase
MDVAVWLRSLGLEQYEAAFRDNAVDEAVLPKLTAEDLKELGVAAVGHRRMLLDAVAQLRLPATAAEIASSAAPSVTAPAATETSAERRQVTVMFSDLAGLAARSAGMDPEDFGDIVAAYHTCVAQTVQRFGGFVAAYMGDGVLVYFGYPEAHEDDAERAVRTGLETVAAVGALKTHASLQTRVGIATGLVVIGDLFGAGAVGEQDVVGETPNLAARLQSIAQPDTVVLAESTRKLVGNLFELADLGVQTLKGIAAPVQAWTALRASSVESRFDALHATGLTELVGREEELELLLRRWSKSKSGEGQVVLLSGEAGIGKSRLTAALLERLAGEPHTRLRYFCSPQHTDSALYPIISQLERAAGLAHHDTAQAKRDKLDGLLARSLAARADAALFAELLSLPNDGRYPTLDLTPQQRREKTLEAFSAQIDALSRLHPLLMIFEDVHWIDPTSLEALGRTLARLTGLRALLVITYRPEFSAPWIGQPHATAMTVNRLGPREIDAMIDQVVGDKSLPASIRRDILERADGVPLFVEEMTKAVLEGEDEQAMDRLVAGIPAPSLTVPPSLHASLMARLDRLGQAKELAQIAAAIGREFSHALLAAVAQKPQGQLQAALDRLLDAGLLFRQGVSPHFVYLFKHALLRDAAYGTLLREQRRAYHARIAETLANEFDEVAESQPELLARHYAEAGLVGPAASQWSKAGQRSLARSALVEAVEQLTQALAHIESLPSTWALRREEIKLQVALITPLMHVRGYAAPATKAAVEKARVLIERAEARGEPPEDPLLLFTVLYGFWVANYVAFDGDMMRELASQYLALAEKQDASIPRVTGHRLMGVSLLHIGDFLQARRHLDQAVSLYDPAVHRALAARFGQDVRVSALFYRPLALWPLGWPAAALEDAGEAIKEARETGQAANLLAALALTSLTHILCGNFATAGAHLDELTAFAEEKRALFWKTGGIVIKGCLLAMIGQSSESVPMMKSALTAWQPTGTTVRLPMYLSYLAKAQADIGHFDDAKRNIADAMAAINASKEMWYEAELHRLAGEIELRSPERDAMRAQAYFDQALAIARRQQARSWELRAAMSLARLWRDQGKAPQARELLAPIYGWFTEGFDTRDLKDAKALLQELAP